LFDRIPDIPVLAQYQKARRRKESVSNLNPFSFQLRLFNPEALLRQCKFLEPVLFHPITAWLWCGLIIWALLRTSLRWDEIHAYAGLHMLSPRCLLLAWLAYPLMKVLHELGHAIAVQRWGGTVKEAGIGFFLLVPAPYIDASAATAFSTKWKRAAVSFAGIAVELALAAIALFFWCLLENGLLREAAFAVMAIGGLSTIVFNGNPLMRFDGYYILCDLFELPNLALRSQRWWTQLLRRFGGGVQGREELQARGSEHIWLCCYAPASWVYRVVLSIVILQWVVAKSVILGFVTLLWLGYSLIVRPVWGFLTQTFFGGQAFSQSQFRIYLVSGVLICILGVVFLFPIPVNTISEGVVWLPDQSHVRTSNDAQVSQILAQDGQQVIQGQALVVLEEPSLLIEKRRLLAQIASAESEQADAWNKEAQQGRNAAEQLVRLRTDLEQVDSRLNGLTLRSEADGRFVLPIQEDLIGRHLNKGALIAYVLSTKPATVRVAVTQDDFARIKSGAKSISVHLTELGNRYFNGQILRLDPAATRTLPSKVIGDHGGGSLQTDPNDPGGLTTLEPIFLIDVQVPELHNLYMGGRATVRFSFEDKPLADTLGLRIRQAFLKTFSSVKTS